MAPRKPTLLNGQVKRFTTAKPSGVKKNALPLISHHQAKAKAGMVMKQIFTKQVMVLAGEFDETYEQIAGWITAHGGRRDREVTEETTHLICSIAEFKKATPAGTSPQAFPLL
jgi:hypothetical protein